MHHESLLAQIACRSLLEGLVTRCSSPEERDFMAKGTFKASMQHLLVIQRFGRYPSRNEILGRESTEEERKFLKENPDGMAKVPEGAELKFAEGVVVAS